MLLENPKQAFQIIREGTIILNYPHEKVLEEHNQIDKRKRDATVLKLKTEEETKGKDIIALIVMCGGAHL